MTSDLKLRLPPSLIESASRSVAVAGRSLMLPGLCRHHGPHGNHHHLTPKLVMHGLGRPQKTCYEAFSQSACLGIRTLEDPQRNEAMPPFTHGIPTCYKMKASSSKPPETQTLTMTTERN